MTITQLLPKDLPPATATPSPVQGFIFALTGEWESVAPPYPRRNKTKKKGARHNCLSTQRHATAQLCDFMVSGLNEGQSNSRNNNSPVIRLHHHWTPFLVSRSSAVLANSFPFGLGKRHLDRAVGDRSQRCRLLWIPTGAHSDRAPQTPPPYVLEHGRAPVSALGRGLCKVV